MNTKDSKIDFLYLGKRPEIGPNSIALNFIMEKILRENHGCIYSGYSDAYTNVSLKEIIEMIEKLDGRKFHEHVFADSNSANIVYIWDHGMAEITYSPSARIQLEVCSLDEKFAKDLFKSFQDIHCETTQQGFIFAIMRSGSNLQLTRIGYAGVPLERENYSKKVIEDFDFVIKDLKSNSPSGRITILEGSPGTGKTFLTRSILMEVPDAMFVLVPPTMVSSLGGPDLLPLLLKNKEDWSKKGPTVLILEDADQCLVPRQGDNMASISSILNLGDGIFGSLFDIRIIATTNARKTEMDPAIIRAGRLSRRIEVNSMEYEEANQIFKRLVPNKDMPKILIDTSLLKPLVKKDTYTLAEIYKSARDEGWTPEGNIKSSDNKRLKRIYEDDDDILDY